MAEHQDDPNFEVWRMLKEGYDHCERTRVPPKIDVGDKRYVFNRLAEDQKAFKPQEACPVTAVPDSLAMAYGKLISKEDEVFQKALKTKAVKDTWAGRTPEPVINASIKPAEMPVPASVLSVQTLTGGIPAGTGGGSASAPTSAVPVQVPVPTPAPSMADMTAEPVGAIKPGG